MKCKNCGGKIPENTYYCSQCAVESKNENDLVGWSTRYNNPEIVAVVKKKNRLISGYFWSLILVFPIGFLIAGMFFNTMPLIGGLGIGFVLGLMMVVINMLYVKNRRSQIWEGVIIEKYQKETPVDVDSQQADSDDVDIDYVLIVEKTDGQKHPMIYQNRSEMYDYFQIGDRVRYYVGLATYEKYDKSKDSIIYCNVCMTENPISNDRCEHCSNLLFK